MNEDATDLEPLVLVADNDTGVRDLLCEVLRRHGMQTVVAGDGEEALKRLAVGPVDLLVCDLDMPLMGGEEVIRRLGDFASPPPVLVVSGYIDSLIERDLTSQDVVRGVFRKPFDVFAFAAEAANLAGCARSAEAGEAS